MKFLVFALLFSMASVAGEIQTSLSESQNGLSFSLHEVVYPGEEAPLWKFAQSLSKKEVTTSDKNFSFRCKQTLNAKSVFETRCSGVLRNASVTTAAGTIGDDFITITLKDKPAEEFISILPAKSGVVSLNIQDKLVLIGSKVNLGILVSH